MTTTEVRAVKVESGPTAVRPSRPIRRRSWILGVSAFVLFAGALGYLAGNETQANTQFDQAHHALIVTRHSIAVVSQDLATVRHDLGVVNGQVAVASTTLTNDASKLAGARTALANAQADVSRQSSAITSLQACLGGVEQALNALSLGDQTRALSALQAVSASCNSAVSANG